MLISVDQVLPLAQDKWLLDTYLNANGQIRYVLVFSPGPSLRDEAETFLD